MIADLVALQYKRNDQSFVRGTFRARRHGRVFPAHYEDRAWRVSLFGDEVEEIAEFDPLTGQKSGKLDEIKLYANSHYVTPRPTLNQAIEEIKHDLQVRLQELKGQGKLLEAQRLEQRTQFDIEMMEATGSCAGIENYSRYLTGRKPGEPPPTLFEYLPDNAIVFADESHVTVPQIGGMFTDPAQIDAGRIRLPPALLRRQPAMRFEEWNAMRPQSVVSATPGLGDGATGGVFVEQVIRPTGPSTRRPSSAPSPQVDDLIANVTKWRRRASASSSTLTSAWPKT